MQYENVTCYRTCSYFVLMVLLAGSLAADMRLIIDADNLTMRVESLNLDRYELSHALCWDNPDSIACLPYVPNETYHRFFSVQEMLWDAANKHRGITLSPLLISYAGFYTVGQQVATNIKKSCHDLLAQYWIKRYSHTVCNALWSAWYCALLDDQQHISSFSRDVRICPVRIEDITIVGDRDEWHMLQACFIALKRELPDMQAYIAEIELLCTYIIDLFDGREDPFFWCDFCWFDAHTQHMQGFSARLLPQRFLVPVRTSYEQNGKIGYFVSGVLEYRLRDNRYEPIIGVERVE